VVHHTKSFAFYARDDIIPGTCAISLDCLRSCRNHSFPTSRLQCPCTGQRHRKESVKQSQQKYSLIRKQVGAQSRELTGHLHLNNISAKLS